MAWYELNLPDERKADVRIVAVHGGLKLDDIVSGFPLRRTV
jgi:hypothetical protein